MLAHSKSGSHAPKQNKKRPSKLVNKKLDTPLDRFFLAFSSFPYDPTLAPAKSYENLRKHMGWRKHGNEAKKVWSLYREALKDEVKVWFGSTDDIQAWHTLCRAVGIMDPPAEIKACAKVSIFYKLSLFRNGVLTISCVSC